MIELSQLCVCYMVFIEYNEYRATSVSFLYVTTCEYCYTIYHPRTRILRTWLTFTTLGPLSYVRD